MKNKLQCAQARVRSVDKNLKFESPANEKREKLSRELQSKSTTLSLIPQVTNATELRQRYVLSLPLQHLPRLGFSSPFSILGNCVEAALPTVKRHFLLRKEGGRKGKSVIFF